MLNCAVITGVTAADVVSFDIRSRALVFVSVHGAEPITEQLFRTRALLM